MLVAAVAAIVFALTFNPNRYKSDIERAVKERTGRTLHLNGPLQVAFFPSLGANATAVSLSERGSDAPFVSFDFAHASVALGPLLHGEVVIDGVELRGLKATIVKGKNGEYNFSDLMERKGSTGAGGSSAGTQAPAPAGGSKVVFDIGGIKIENANVLYRDLAAGQELSLTGFSLTTGRIAENAQGKLALSTTVQRKAPALTAKLSANGRYSIAPQELALDLDARLDESSLRGKLAMTRAARPSYTFDLAIDKLDLDHYLGSQKEAKQETQPATGKSEPKSAPAQADQPIDFSGLKGVNAKGHLQIGALQVKNLKLANVKTDVAAADGRAQVGPHSADLYQGNVSGTLVLDANGNRVGLKEALAGVALGPLLQDFAQQDRLEGRGNVSLDVASSGASVGALERALAGNARVELRDGAIKGIDIGAILDKARAALGRKSAEGAASGKERTDFTALTASFAIRNGIAHNDDLDVKAPLFRAGGAGDIDIPKGTVNYVAKISVVASAKGQGGAGLDQLAGVTVPVRVSGPFDSLKYSVDLGGAAAGLAKSKAGAKLKENVEKNKGKVEQKLREGLKGLLGK